LRSDAELEAALQYVHEEKSLKETMVLVRQPRLRGYMQEAINTALHDLSSPRHMDLQEEQTCKKRKSGGQEEPAGKKRHSETQREDTAVLGAEKSGSGQASAVAGEAAEKKLASGSRVEDDDEDDNLDGLDLDALEAASLGTDASAVLPRGGLKQQELERRTEKASPGP